MAVIYMPQDQRFAMIGQGIVNAINGHISQNRIKQIQDLLNKPDVSDQDMAQAEALAQGDPTGESQKMLTSILQMKQFRSIEEERKASIAHMQHEDKFKDTLLPSELARNTAATQASQASTAASQAKTANLPFENQMKAATAGAAVQRANAATVSAQAAKQRADLAAKGMEQFNLALKKYAQPTVDGIRQQQQQSQTPLYADPSSGYGQGYNLNGDPLSKNLAKLNMAWGTRDIPAGVTQTFKSPDGRSFSVKGPTPLSDQDMKEVSGLLASSQTMKALYEIMQTDGDKIHSGPVQGKIQSLVNKLSQNIAQIDPNINYEDLIGHQLITITSSMSNATRTGIGILNLLKGIAAGENVGLAQNMSRVRKGTRIIRDNAGVMTAKAVGGNVALDPGIMNEIDSNTKEVLQAGKKAQAKSAPAPAATPPAKAASEKPDKSGFIKGQTYTDAKGNKAVYQGNGQWEETK